VRQELFTETEFPQGLKPGSASRAYSAAKAAPLQNHRSNGFSFRWNSWALLPLVLALLAAAVPWLMLHSPAFALALWRGFALVCHQQPERSFALFGGSVAVCARCLGIYLAAAAGLLVRVPRVIAVRWLTAAVAVNLFDWAAELAGLHGNWMFVRFALGIALGVAGAMIVAASFQINKTPPQAKAA
jgi:uncharacterized membrane protein